jgi:hypothetical protein
MKVGRNSPCICGSGKKYKRCCLASGERVADANSVPMMQLPADVQRALEQKVRVEAQRTQKYGRVPAPVSARHQGKMFVAVGSRLLFDEKWKTFHDFLFTYLGAVFPKDWFMSELEQPLEKRHPLMQWYHLLNDHRRRSGAAPGELVKVDAPPAQVSALLAFAYDLYTLENHSLLQQSLVERLMRKEHFQGARYEMYVAAATIRAGFTIELEDESDLSSNHCEFTATYLPTGAKYSVEAKSRHRTGYLGQAGQPEPLDAIEADLRKLLVPALRKRAKYDRIVFIDVNVPPSESLLLESSWFNKVADQIVRLDNDADAKGLSPALVYLTNFPYHFVEGDEPLRGSAAVMTGFNMPEFRDTMSGPLVIPQKYGAPLALLDSVLRHTAVPHELAGFPE